MDNETAQWLASLIMQASTQLDHHPGLTIEVIEQPEHWVQVILETAEDSPQLTGFVINFPIRDTVTEPLELITGSGIQPPPGTRLLNNITGSMSIWIRADIPLVALALLIGDVMHKVLGTPADSEFEVQVEYGF